MNNLKQTTLTDDNFDADDKSRAIDSQVGGNNAAVRMREIELEARFLSYAEDLMKGFLDEEVSDPDEIRSQKRAYILYNIWWTSFFAIVNLHTEHLCNNRTLHANLRRSCGHFWRANLLPSFDAIKLKAILPKLFVAADRTTLLVLNELWREHQESMYVLKQYPAYACQMVTSFLISVINRVNTTQMHCIHVFSRFFEVQCPSASTLSNSHEITMLHAEGASFIGLSSLQQMVTAFLISVINRVNTTQMHCIHVLTRFFEVQLPSARTLYNSHEITILHAEGANFIGLSSLQIGERMRILVQSKTRR